MTAVAPGEAALRDLVLARLAAEGRAEEPLAQVVLAALEGPEAVDALVEDGVLPDAATRTAAAAAPLGAYVTSVTVEGFRGTVRPRRSSSRPAPA